MVERDAAEIEEAIMAAVPSGGESIGNGSLRRLNDAIEGGLVKTPRVVVRDGALPDARTLRSKLYHLYREDEVSDDLNRRGARPEDPLPELVQKAYTLLGADWREARRAWEEKGHTSPPVMLTVCNRTETAARIEAYFTRGDAWWEELRAPERTLRVDSKVLEKAELGERSGSDKQYEERLREVVRAAGLPPDREADLLALKKEELLREIVDNVGKRGTAGQKLQNVISVAMLSEGWDAKNVTHIMGLRAFTSQLLCEQVIGRGLRRVSHDLDDDGLFKPEYVNVFGVPLSIFQDVDDEGDAPPPPRNSDSVESLPERAELAISWPNVLRVEAVVRPTLTVDWDQVSDLEVRTDRTALTADIAPALGGTTDWSRIHEIDLSKLPEDFRLQRLIFHAARKAFEQMDSGFTGSRELLIYQLVRLVEQLLASDKLVVSRDVADDPLRRRILLSLNVDPIVHHLRMHVEQQNLERMELVFDEGAPIGSTRDMRTWYTTKPSQPTQKSQISRLVGDSAWEGHAGNVLEKSKLVTAYAKNDHLGFHVYYMWKGSRRRYVPDFLIRLATGDMLVLEIKGVDDDQNRAKRAALDAWVSGVNEKGGFGTWRAAVAFDPTDVEPLLSTSATPHHSGLPQR